MQHDPQDLQRIRGVVSIMVAPTSAAPRSGSFWNSERNSLNRFTSFVPHPLFLHLAAAALRAFSRRFFMEFLLCVLMPPKRPVGADFTAPKIAELCDGLKSSLPGDRADFVGKPREISSTR
jgi:hypothetical protein